MCHAKLQFRIVKMDWWERNIVSIISSGRYLDNLNIQNVPSWKSNYWSIVEVLSGHNISLQFTEYYFRLYTVRCFAEILECCNRNFLSSKYFKISSVNFIRACSMLASEIVRILINIICGEIVMEPTTKKLFHKLYW